MAFTTDQLTELETAIAQGALSVRYGDRSITYNTYAEMIRLRDSMRSELGISTPATNRSRFINLPTGKGL
jgi:hypothetical protein